MGQVFLSHVAEDGSVVKEIATGLARAGYSTWYYERDAVGGPDHMRQTREAIERAEAVAVMISPSSLGDQRFVWPEIRRAVKCRRSFMPLLLEVAWQQVEEEYPDWDDALGGAVALSLSPERPADVVPKMIAGLEMLGIRPARAPMTRSDLSPVRIFMSYRRGDVAHMAEMIGSELIEQFGLTNVFFDVFSLKPGEDWARAVERALESCDVFLLLIGSNWPAGGGATMESGFPDRVRREVEVALDSNAIVIPVLVDDAELPLREELPEPLRRLVEIQPSRVTQSGFQDEIARLCKVIESVAR